jgi:membrane protease YdiL (CAAX protease family)
MMTLLAYLPFLCVALLAQWGERSRALRWLTYGLLLAMDALVFLVGGGALLLGGSTAVQAQLLELYPGLSASRWMAFGGLLLVTTVAAPLLLLPSVRRLLARLIPIDAESAVHATALALAVLGMGLNLSQVALIGGLDVVAQAEGQIPFTELLLSNLPLGLFAFVGVGLWVRRDWRQTWERLGVGRISWRQLGLTVGLTVAVLILELGIDWAWETLAPESYQMMESLGEVLFGSVTAIWQGVAISASSGLMEELLFRGAVQPRFGVLLTVFFFTLAHVQYGFTLAALEVLLAAVALAWLRRRVNTTACILLHVLHNLAVLLIFPLFP